MLSFEPSKEIEKDVFSSCVGQRKKFWIPTSNRPTARISIRILLGFLSLCRAQNLLSFLFYLQNMTLTTLLILTICRTRVIYELRYGPCSPQSLCGSVVEHRSTESEGLRFDSLQGLGLLSLSHARDKTKKHLPLHGTVSCVLRDEKRARTHLKIKPLMMVFTVDIRI